MTTAMAYGAAIFMITWVIATRYPVPKTGNAANHY